MPRISNDVYINGILVNGFDYTNQAWVKDGLYVRCGHPESMNCECYGRTHEGQPSQASFQSDLKAFSTTFTPAPAYGSREVH